MQQMAEEQISGWGDLQNKLIKSFKHWCNSKGRSMMMMMWNLEHL